MAVNTRCLRAFILACALLATSACGSLPDGRRWGEDATIRPGWQKVKESAVNAARAPSVWVPLAGTVLFQIGSLDEQLSNWARKHTPLFGSEANADNASDVLRDLSVAGYLGTSLATPSGDTAGEWTLNKAKGFAVGAGAVVLTGGLTDLLKDGVGRERPNQFDNKSFPSGHTSAAAVFDTMSSRNLSSLSLAPATNRALGATFTTFTAGTAWARIEAGWHYPSDVLFGMTLGNFFAAFVNDAFLGLDGASQITVGFEAVDRGGLISFSGRF